MAMKIAPSSVTYSRRLVSALSPILLLLFLPELTDAHKHKPQLSDASITRGKTAAGFDYMTGGTAFDEQQAMERQSAPYNLKLFFAPRSNSLVSPVLLFIGNNHGRRIDKIMAQGPWFYIQLPSGGYTIVARIKNKVVLIRDVYLYANRRATYFVRGD
jgi:hypothetical protein